MPVGWGIPQIDTIAGSAGGGERRVSYLFPFSILEMSLAILSNRILPPTPG
jgi:hypothetical protein